MKNKILLCNPGHSIHVSWEEKLAEPGEKQLLSVCEAFCNEAALS